MTAQETERIDRPIGVAAESPGRTAAAGKAYDRRLRRQQSVTQRLTVTGSPITAALTRVPFVALIILLLAGGVVGVLYLNTVSDAAGLKASDSRRAQMDLNTQIEAANKDIADLNNPAKLAAEAKALGLVPAGDAAIISVGPDGKASIIGTPTPVPTPTAAAPAPTNAAPTNAAPADAAPANAAPVTTGAAAPVTAAAPRTTAPPTTAVKTTPVKTTPAKATPAKTTPAKTTPVKTTPVTTPVKTTPAKATPVKTTPAKTTTPKGAGR